MCVDCGLLCDVVCVFFSSSFCLSSCVGGWLCVCLVGAYVRCVCEFLRDVVWLVFVVVIGVCVRVSACFGVCACVVYV